MKLYYKPGACSMASHIILNELNMPFSLEQVDTDQGTTESGQEFSTINPNGYVPALEINQGSSLGNDVPIIITENPAILQFLGDQDPSNKLAANTTSLERIRLQELLNFLSSELHKSFSPFFSSRTLSDVEKRATQQNIARRINTIERNLSHGQDFLLGTDFTVADAYAFVILNWSNVIGMSLENWPLTCRYMELISQRPAVIQAMTTEGLITQEVSA